MAPLILSLHFEEQLDPIVRNELQNLMASITNWANQSALGQDNITVKGLGTFLGQPRCRLFQTADLPIANGVDTVIPWHAARSGSSIEEYDNTLMFDGSQYIICSEPGVYIAIASISWEANATGHRSSGVHPRISAVDYFDKSIDAGSATANFQQTVAVFPVIEASGAVAQAFTPFPLGIGVQVFQNSGGSLNVLQDSTLGVWKVS